MKHDSNNKDTRRVFMKKAAGAAGAAAATAKVAKADVLKTIFPQTVLGANEIIRTGHIGLGDDLCLGCFPSYTCRL